MAAKNHQRIPVHLEQYREKNLDYVINRTSFPPACSSETAAIAKALGRWIVDAPALREKLVALLKARTGNSSLSGQGYRSPSC